MIAVIYLFSMIMVGDLVCRRYFSFIWLPHRIAAAFLSGLVISSWFTYLCALALMRTSQPLLWGNLLFFVATVGFVLWSRQNLPKSEKEGSQTPGSIKAGNWDWAAVGLITVLTMWLMFSSLNMHDGKLQIANQQWSDFGPNIAIMQSFALGDNFPTEYPHFSGDRIRYHFLFYFQAGNLEYLGLNPALSNNILSILSIVSMLVLVATLGIVLFGSRVVGWIGAALFFFHGSLAYIPFFDKHGSISEAFNYALTMKDFLPSGFPYRGEEWGVWSQVVFLNQRHFASAIGIFLLVFLFLVIHQKSKPGIDDAEANRQENGARESRTNEATLSNSPKLEVLYGLLAKSSPYIFSGVLLGLMPLWNSAVFTAAFAVLGLLFILFPLKKEMAVLAITTGIIALPQVIFLKTGNIPDAGYSLFHWGYVIDDPSITNVVKYLIFTFGFKWLLIGIGLYFATQFQRKIFAAISVLFILAFLFQFSVEVLANHKFLNIWLIIANVYAAYGLWRLWNLDWFKSQLPAKIATVALLILVTIGGVLDFFPIHNGYWMELPFEGDELVTWLRQNTDPKAIFLTDRFVTHGILLAGRRVFHGHTYYTWGAGYPASQRDEVYRRMFEERNPQEIFRLLKDNNISYVAIDNQVRNGGFIKNLNEAVYKKNFANVFHDEQSKYNGLDIYKVDSVQPGNITSDTNETVSLPAVNAFEGGEGSIRGQFNRPRGIAVDAKGNFYIADGGNSRIQKFSADGTFASSFGKPGTGEGELKEPTGIVVDASGAVWVTDAVNNRLLKFKADGTFEKQWSGPDPSFLTPRDLAIAPNNKIYILDQSRGRIVRFDPKTEQFTSWGQTGTGDDEFIELTGIAIGNDRIYVADAKVDRIQVFDLDGRFLGQWNVPQWDKYIWHRPDVVVDADAKKIYVTSGWTKEVLVFDMDGKYLESIKPEGKEALTNPSAITLLKTKATNRLLVLDTGSDAIQTGGARVAHFELGGQEKK